MSTISDPLDGLPRAVDGTDVADALRLAIVDGTLPPGTRLAQLQIARVMGTSRTPVREALHKLHSWGLVDLVVNHAAVVRRNGRRQYREAFVVWAELAALSVELTVQSGSAVGSALRSAVEQERAVVDETMLGARPSARMGQRWVEAQRAFHEALLEGSTSRRLRETVATTTELLRWETIWSAVAGRLYPLRSTADSHEAITALIEKSDGAGAADAMRRHIDELCESFLAWSDRQGDGDAGEQQK
jgi:DNA-binding GntR family transcriptional regulator